MFALTMGAGMDMGFPDACKTPTPAGPIPIPYPNIAMSATTAPVVPNVLIDCMPSINMASKGLISNGDQAGVVGGLIDSMIMGQTNYNVGCFTIFFGGTPAQRLTSVTGQNSAGLVPNAVGLCSTPSQVTVTVLG
jgi:hypothetical protein